jgi:secreted trypsin-like serine protease
VGSRLRLLGWGVDCANPDGCGRELPRLLNQVDVTTVEAAQCAPGRGEEITEICHDNPRGADACTFDSGGPALIDGRLAGVASRDGSGPDCGDGTGIYTSVPAYRDFIDETINRLPSSRND